MEYIEHYLARRDALPGQQLPWLRAFRDTAQADFSARGFPSARDEEWRYTSLAKLERKRFLPHGEGPESALDARMVDRQRLDSAHTLVFVDGRYVPEHSGNGSLPAGVRVSTLGQILDQDPAWLQTRLGTVDAHESHGLHAFNSACFSDGACIEISPGVRLEQPLQILHLSTRPEGLAVLRHIVALGRNAEARIVETYAGQADAEYLTVALTEITLEDNASLEHYKLQTESANSHHFGGIYARQNAHARLHQHHSTFGGQLSRTEIHSRLGHGAECELNGLFLVSGQRHADTHTVLHHEEAHATSSENYRGIATDRGRGVFSGRIVVDRNASKTNAEMNNRNLLLSAQAEIDSKPQLEINADDVRCAHGVTVGELDAEALFYLASRGVDDQSARNLLTFAFANEMVEKIRIESLKSRVQAALLAALPTTGIRGDWL